MKRFKTLRRPPSALAEQQALGWITKITGAPLSSKQQADFAVWLSLDASHRRLFDELTDIWELTGQLRAAALDRIKASTTTNSALETVDSTSQSDQPAEQTTQQRPTPNIWQRVTAAATEVASGLKNHIPLAASALLAITIVWLSSSEDPNTRWLETGTGDYTKILLTDGSRLHLNTNTKVRVAYTEQARLLQLIKGELFVEVAKDAERPLTVATQSFSATAIGTAFGVATLAADEAEAEQAFVAVAHGEVLVSSNSSADYRARGDGTRRQTQTLVAGDSLTVEPSAADLGSLRPASQQIASWRGGQLIYEDVALQALITDLNRYHAQQLVIQSNELRKVRLSAVLTSTDYSAAVAALCSSLGLTAQRLSDSVTLLSQAPAS